MQPVSTATDVTQIGLAAARGLYRKRVGRGQAEENAERECKQWKNDTAEAREKNEDEADSAQNF